MRPPAPAGGRLLPACLFFSGASSLVLEVAWSRALSLSLGNSHQAVATVVASMMTGLCLGSLIAARLLPRLERLPRAYGLVEMAIGSYSALTPLIFHALPSLLAPLYALPSPAFGAIRFLLVFLILLPAAGGMGATLPIVTAALSRGRMEPDPPDSGSIGGRLYGLNTLGAFLGTLIGGFVLLPSLGLLKTTLLGSATSLGVGAFVALILPGKVGEMSARREHQPVPATGREGGFLILPLYAASGCLAMIYEITWTRVLAPLVGTSVYSFTLILASILAGIGLGSLILSSRRASLLDPGRGFVTGQILLGGTAFLSVWGLSALPDRVIQIAAATLERPGPFFVLEFFLLCAIVLLPGLVLGALFPFAARLLRRLERESGAEVGRVYAWNTAGSLVGSLGAGFFLVETLGSEATLLYASAASVLLGLAGLALVKGPRFRLISGVAGACLAASFPFLGPSWDVHRMTGGIAHVLRDLQRQGSHASAEATRSDLRAPDLRVIFHREGKTSTVTVVQEWLDRWMRVDGKTDASTTAEDMPTQILSGQLPFFFAPRARDACVIGYGSGVSSHAVLTHPVRRLDNIEIEAKVIEASRLFEAVNLRPLADPRSRLIIEDARTALLYRPRSYDVIISEPSNPWMAGVNNLFTSEFYDLVRRRLNRGGIFCQWAQLYEMSAESLATMLDTLSASFPHVHLFSLHRGSDLLLLASESPLSLVPGAADLFPDRPQVVADLARAEVRNLADLAVRYIAPVPAPAAGTVLNTDDNSLIQYRAPLDMLRRKSPALRLQTSLPVLLRLFYPGRPDELALIELGRAALRQEDIAKASRFASALAERGPSSDAAELKTGVQALRRRLADRAQVDDLLRQAEQGIASGDAARAIAALEQAEVIGMDGVSQASRSGYAWLMVGRYIEAERHLDEAASDLSDEFRYQSLSARGAARYRLGRREEGLADIAAAKALLPDQPLAYLLLGLALSDAGERAEAMRELEEGLRVAPGDERLRRALSLSASAPSRAGG